MQSLEHCRLGARAAVVAIAVALAGCEGTVSVDLGTKAPADPRIEQVFVELDGVEFQGSGGNETLEFDVPQRVGLMNYLDSNDFRVLTDEQLGDGNYSGVRLLFGPDDDEDNVVYSPTAENFRSPSRRRTISAPSTSLSTRTTPAKTTCN